MHKDWSAAYDEQSFTDATVVVLTSAEHGPPYIMDNAVQRTTGHGRKLHLSGLDCPHAHLRCKVLLEPEVGALSSDPDKKRDFKDHHQPGGMY